jgi:hypothetical protein
MLRPEDCIPGTLVECIDNTPRPGFGQSAPLVLGRIYTLATHCQPLPRGRGYNPIYIGEPAVSLMEVRRPDQQLWALSISRFRLLPEERLAVFRQMLAPAPKTERVDAP